ncbi:hypothetical protein OPIT5_00260 (plasmid) [Opitutaceae bacterium TAV5]|nr:hypothetical protein OPIT5_00260 [Opitutaceae bacterium TAV5]
MFADRFGNEEIMIHSPPENIDLTLTRVGEFDDSGAYFGIDGESTYSEAPGARRYVLRYARLADTRKAGVAIEIITETLKDPRIDSATRVRLTEALEVAETIGGPVHYMDFDETPMVASAKRLGYDAVRVAENDDFPGSASSVFVINIACITPLEALPDDLPKTAGLSRVCSR